MYLDRLFKIMADRQASDLFISCGAPINIKINGVVMPLGNRPMDVDTVRRVAYELMSEDQARVFENEHEMNLSHLDPAVGNFRVNIFRQRGTISIVARYVRSSIPPFEQLKLPPVLLDLVMERYREAVKGDLRMNCDSCVYRIALPGFEDKVGLPQQPHFHPDDDGHHHGHHHGDHAHAH